MSVNVPTGDESTDLKKEEEIDPRCIVKFRPHDNWKGEYGFDWFREGDYEELFADGSRGRDERLVNTVGETMTIKSKSNYKDNLVGKYYAFFYLCESAYSRDNNSFTQLHKDELTDRKGNSLCYSKYDFNDAPLFYSEKICSHCRGNSNCYLHPSIKQPMIDDSSRVPMKADPDCLKTQLSLLNDNGNYRGYYVQQLITDNYSIIGVKDNTNYIVPTISLFYENIQKEKEGAWGSNNADVKLLINGKNINVDINSITLEFKCSRGIKQINKINRSEIIYNSNTKFYEALINIKLTDVFREFSIKEGNGYIKVYAVINNNTAKNANPDRFLAGKIIVEKCIPKSVSVVLVPVAVQLNAAVLHYEHSLKEEKKYLKQYLYHAHIIPGSLSVFSHHYYDVPVVCFSSEKVSDILKEHIDSATNGRFLKLYDKNGKYLIEEFERLFNIEYPNLKCAYKIFLMGVDCVVDNEGNEYVGKARKIPSKSAIVCRSRFFDSTVVHELLHCFGLWHSFSNNSQHTFEKHKTSNMMDYNPTQLLQNTSSIPSQQITPYGLNLVSSWKWQWKIIRKQLDNDYIKSSLSPLHPIIKY